MQSHSTRTSAALQRLRFAEPEELSKALEELIDSGEGLSDAAEIIEERVKSKTFVFKEQAARLLVNEKRESLYRLLKDELFGDRWALLTLYKGGYPDQRIENELCQQLYRMANDDSDIYRRDVAEAMGEVGTTATLPVLEAILYDIAPTAGAKNAITNAIFSASGDTLESILAGAEAGSRSQFVRSVAQSIEAIRRRDEDPDQASVENNSANSEVNQQLVINAHKELENAKNKVNEDPTYALVCLRRGAEAVGKHYYRYLGLEKKGEPAKRKMLGHFEKIVNDSDAPDLFKLYFKSIQPFGNYGSHDQDDEPSITVAAGEALIVLFEEALRSYEGWLIRHAENSE